MNSTYLLIGGNMGNRPANLSAAIAAIETTCGLVKATSQLYETEAWGLKEQPAFLNQALHVHTPLQPEALLTCLLRVEKSLGRIRQQKFGPRLIDVDILLFENLILDTPHLQIPHPQLPYRRFALQCLADIAVDEIHPLFQKSIGQLLAECTDLLKVNKFS